MTAPTPAAPPKKKTPPRDYVVLEPKDGGLFKMLGTFKGTSAENAIRAMYAATDGAPLGTLVAVPKRNWSSLRPKLETKTTITFS